MVGSSGAGQYAGPMGARADRRHRWGLGLAGGLTLPAIAALISGTVQVTRCVAVPDGVAQLGIHLALLRSAADCPTTGLALGGEPQQVLGVALVLTVPMVLLHLLAVAGGWGALRAVRESLARLARLTPWRMVPQDVTAPTGLPRLPVRARLTRHYAGTHVHVPLRRGPPVVLPV